MYFNFNLFPIALYSYKKIDGRLYVSTYHIKIKRSVQLAQDVVFGQKLNQLQSIFKLNGIQNVIGMTPIIEGRTRGFEINEYIRNTKGTELEVQQFVILDDEEEMGDLEHFLIETEFQTGITNSIKDEIIKRLSNLEIFI